MISSLSFRISLVSFALVLFSPIAFAQGSGADAFSSFSSFGQIDLERLAQGEVLAARGPLMNFQRGLFVESCFLVQAPIAKTIDVLEKWDPAKHESLGVYVHHAVSMPPVPGDFSDLTKLPDNKGVKALIDQTLHLNPNQPDLQISKEEAGAFKAIQASMAASKPGDKAIFAACWTPFLVDSVTHFLSGSKLPVYENGDIAINVTEELHNLMSENPKILEHFKPLTTESPLGRVVGSGSSSMTNLKSLYWEAQDVEGSTAIDLGSMYAVPVADGWQIEDFEYYVSTGYIASVILYHAIPVTTKAGPATLIWRGDFVSAPSIAYLHGVERVASGMIMMQDIKKSDVFLQKDVVKTP